MQFFCKDARNYWKNINEKFHFLLTDRFSAFKYFLVPLTLAKLENVTRFFTLSGRSCYMKYIKYMYEI